MIEEMEVIKGRLKQADSLLTILYLQYFKTPPEEYNKYLHSRYGDMLQACANIVFEADMEFGDILQRIKRMEAEDEKNSQMADKEVNT